MNPTYLKLSVIVVVAFIFRLLLLPMIHNPGLHDSVHYYNLGRRLSEGQGFTIDYVWHYSRMPVELEHPIDHWMPMAGIAAALGMSLAGATVHAALMIFVLIGSLVPLLAFAASKQLNQSDSVALLAASISAVLPEFVWNSLHTDTTILSMAFVTTAILLLQKAADLRRKLFFIFSGFLFGLAYLTRNDSIIFVPMLILFALALRRRIAIHSLRDGFFLLIVVFAITISPWLLRNLNEIGTLGSSLTVRMPFMVEHVETYAYGVPISFESMLEHRTLQELAGKRLFELAAALKQMAVSLQLPLVIFVPLGIGWLVTERKWVTLLPIMPVLLWMLLILIAYPVLMPVLNQAGSFKKAFITIIPLLIPIGAMSVTKFIRHTELRWALVAATLLWLGWSSFDLIRRDAAKADRFYDSMRILMRELESLPDVTGDGRIILMSQDPFVLSDLGYTSVVTPHASREDTIEIAQLYDVDYLLMPAGRPALDALYLGKETDPRFELAAHLAHAGEKPFELYRIAANK